MKGFVGAAAVFAVLAAAGGGIFFATSHSGGVAAPSKARSAVSRGHVFFPPECAPLQAERWEYPGPTRIESDRYESFAIHYSCALAAQWTKRLAGLTIPVRKQGTATVLAGPQGFVCEAWPDAVGHAYAGGCQKGDEAAFGWNWNVENPRQALIAVDGSYHLVSLGGADVETVLTAVARTRYRLRVLNTSGIGILKGFDWTPPPGSKIDSIKSVSGATCKLQSATRVSCTGSVSAPSCLCKGDGGAVTIEVVFASPLKQHEGTGGAKVAITAMTPFPYLIPGTPRAAKRQQGV
jgi:hypothetical protein